MDAALLEILVCPITHSRLRQEGDFLISKIGGLKYPIKDGLPVLLPEAAIFPPGVTLQQLRDPNHTPPA
jgi:uncharacterized protein YbaR (Trm112 family)